MKYDYFCEENSKTIEREFEIDDVKPSSIYKAGLEYRRVYGGVGIIIPEHMRSTNPIKRPFNFDKRKRK